MPLILELLMLCNRNKQLTDLKQKFIGFVSIGDPLNLIRSRKWDFSNRTPNDFERQPVHKPYQQQYIGPTSIHSGQVTKLSRDSTGKQGWAGFYPKDRFLNTPCKVGPYQLSVYKSICRDENKNSYTQYIQMEDC